MTARLQEDDWSVAMVLDHLRQADEATARILTRLTRRASAVSTAPAPSEVEIRYDIEGAPEKVMSYPVFVGMAPAETASEGCLDELAAAREMLEQAIMQAYTVDCSAQQFPHPVVGPMNPYEWILFVGIHETGHQGQIRGILRRLGEPAGGMAPTGGTA